MTPNDEFPNCKEVPINRLMDAGLLSLVTTKAHRLAPMIKNGSTVAAFLLPLEQVIQGFRIVNGSSVGTVTRI